ncbi:MAG: alpha-amylase family glycosyl hydrolase [Polyangiales bacterium]
MPSTTCSSQIPARTAESLWWRHAVVYQVYLPSFQDSNDDGIGDLLGLRQRLPYIKSLGVDALWVTPFYASPFRDCGYDVRDHCDVDPRFGTLADIDTLISEAHALDMRLMLDQVYSHTSDTHPWFDASRRDSAGPFGDWYVWADAKADGSPPNNWLSALGSGSAWSWDAHRHQYYLHNFDRSQPDLNFHCPAVQEATLDIARFWLERGVDALRLDVANYYFHDAQLRDNPPRQSDARADVWLSPHGMQAHRYERSQPGSLRFAARLRQLVDSYPGRMVMGELFSDHPATRIREYTAPEHLHTTYSYAFLGKRFDTHHFRAQLAALPLDTCWPTWTFSNHDRPRVLSRWSAQDESHPSTTDLEADATLTKAKAKCLQALLLSLPGMICLYQGEELGLPEAQLQRHQLRDPLGIQLWPEYQGRDGCRTPMPWQRRAKHAGFGNAQPWLPIAPSHLHLAVDQQQDDVNSVLYHCKCFIELRKQHPAFQSTTLEWIACPAAVLAFYRGTDSTRLAMFWNLSPTHVTLDRTLLRDQLDIVCSNMEGETTSVFASPTLRPWEYRVLSKPSSE